MWRAVLWQENLNLYSLKIPSSRFYLNEYFVFWAIGATHGQHIDKTQLLLLWLNTVKIYMLLARKFGNGILVPSWDVSDRECAVSWRIKALALKHARGTNGYSVALHWPHVMSSCGTKLTHKRDKVVYRFHSAARYDRRVSVMTFAFIWRIFG